MSNKSLHQLDLHEELRLSLMTIKRVPGGWLYERHGSHDIPGYMVFVPYNDEFKEKEELNKN